MKIYVDLMYAQRRECSDITETYSKYATTYTVLCERIIKF